MKRRRIIGLVMAIAMLFSTLPLAVYADDVTQPVIKFTGNPIKKSNDFFELTMEVTPGSKGFSAAGVVLQYDAAVIKPAAWDEAGTSMITDACVDWRNVAAVPTVSGMKDINRSAFAYEKEGKGYISLVAEASLPLTTLSNDGKILTMRFKYAGEDSDAVAANKTKVLADFANVLSLAPDDVAAASPIGQIVYYNAGDADFTEYYYTLDAETTTGLKRGELVTAPALELGEEADSANAATSDPSQFAPVVFFDWDASTLLGSTVVDATMEKSEILATINEYTKNLLPDDVNMSWFTAADAATEKRIAAEAALEASEDKENPESAENVALTAAKEEETAALAILKGYTKHDPTYPLASHNGYTFGKWIDFESEDFTVYGQSALPTKGASLEQLSPPESPSFDDLSNGIILKAAYIANDILESIEDNESLRFYTISNDTNPNGGYFGRFGTSSNYAVRVKVTRVNEAGVPVHRTRTTALKATYKAGDLSIVSLVNLKDIDEQIAEVAVPAKAESVSFVVIDIGGVSAWASASSARSLTSTVNYDDFFLYGNVNYMNELAETTTSGPSNTYFTNAGLVKPAADNVFGGTGLKASALRDLALANIKLGQEQKAAAEGYENRYLTQTEMQNAISRGDYTKNE